MSKFRRGVVSLDKTTDSGPKITEDIIKTVRAQVIESGSRGQAMSDQEIMDALTVEFVKSCPASTSTATRCFSLRHKHALSGRRGSLRQHVLALRVHFEQRRQRRRERTAPSRVG